MRRLAFDRPLWAIIVTFLCAVSSLPALGDVSATTDSTGQRVTAVIVELSLTEDGEPWSVRAQDEDSRPHRHPLNPDGDANGDGRPTVTIHPNTGEPLVAWSRNAATGFEVVISRFADGAWTPPRVVANGPGSVHDPTIAVDGASGALHLAYWVEGDGARVFHREASADLQAWSEPALVSRPGEDAARPSAVVHAGRLLVVYESYPSGLGTTPREIVLGEAIDGVWSSETVASSEFCEVSAPRIQRQPGRVWIEWFDGLDVMRWSSRRDGETWSPLGAEPFEGLEDREYHVRGRIRAAVRALDP